jgi:hypothetical protein
MARRAMVTTTSAESKMGSRCSCHINTNSASRSALINFLKLVTRTSWQQLPQEFRESHAIVVDVAQSIYNTAHELYRSRGVFGGVQRLHSYWSTTFAGLLYLGRNLTGLKNDKSKKHCEVLQAHLLQLLFTRKTFPSMRQEAVRPDIHRSASIITIFRALYFIMQILRHKLYPFRV